MKENYYVYYNIADDGTIFCGGVCRFFDGT